MKQKFEGVVFDTARASHLGMVEGGCDHGKVENHLYRTPAGEFFFHRKFPPLYAVEVGMMEEITPVKDRHELVEWAEVHPDPAEAARLICGGVS